MSKGLSEKNQQDWKKAIQITKNTPFETNIVSYMKTVQKKRAGIDIPCYIDENSIKTAIRTSRLTPRHVLIYAFGIKTMKKNIDNTTLGYFQIIAPLAVGNINFIDLLRNLITRLIRYV